MRSPRGRAAAKTGVGNRSLPVRLGYHFHSCGVNTNALVKAWAKRGEEAINKMEFRQQVRKVLEAADVKDIDALFDHLDADHGGTLDVDELKAGIQL